MSMADQTTFGRRTTPSRHTARGAEVRQPPETASNALHGEPLDERSRELLRHIASPPIDADAAEFHEWKKARKRHSGLPWRQISLMASVSFAVGSLVLPDSAGATLDWILYGLAAASAYAGLSRRLSSSSDD